MLEVDNTGDRSHGDSDMATANKTKRHAANGKPTRKAYVKTLRAPTPRASASKPKSRKGANPKRTPPLSRREPPAGNEWQKRLARLLASYRSDKVGLSIPAAAEKFGLDQHLWYRIESGALPQTAGLHLDPFLAKLGLAMEIKLVPVAQLKDAP
jgi:hypothetical protein